MPSKLSSPRTVRTLASLPDNILVKIFQFAVVNTESASLRDAPINLTHTCRSWRELALARNNSKLWSQFRTGALGFQQKIHVELAFLWLKRAGDETLNFRVLALRPEGDDRINAFLRSLLNKHSQWGEMVINFNIGSDHEGTKLVDLTRLKLLDLTWNGLPIYFKFPFSPLPEDKIEFNARPLFTLDFCQRFAAQPLAPNLRKLVFRGKFFGSMTFEGLKAMLRNCPRLGDLSVFIACNTYDLKHFIEDEPLYTLPRLHTLRLEGAVGLFLFLKTLAAPALRTLKIRVTSYPEVGRIVGGPLDKQLAEFIVNSGYGAPIQVAHLMFSDIAIIDESVAEQSRWDLLHALSGVINLAMHAEHTGYTLRLLTLDDSDSKPENRLCPKLARLYLDLSQARYYLAQIGALLKSRFKFRNTFRATIRIAEWETEEQDIYLIICADDYIMRYIIEGRLAIIRSSDDWCARRLEYFVTLRFKNRSKTG